MKIILSLVIGFVVGVAATIVVMMLMIDREEELHEDDNE